MLTQICIAVIIEKDNKILLAQETKNKPYEKSKNLWTIPAGKVEPRESLVQSAIREVKEETGLDVKLNGLLGVYNMVSNKGQSLGVAFKARVIKEVIEDYLKGEFLPINRVRNTLDTDN